MKNPVKKSSKTILRLLAIAIILLNIPACDLLTIDPRPDQPSKSHVKSETFLIGPEGGTIKALNSNVTLNIPKLALDKKVTLVIKKGPIDYYGDFVINSIEISPKTVFFKTPVGLKLKYNGQLSCGNDPCTAKSLVIYHFSDEVLYDKRNPKDLLWTSKCCLNQINCCIEAEIQSGGIFAVGEESLGQPAIFHN